MADVTTTNQGGIPISLLVSMSDGKMHVQARAVFRADAGDMPPEAAMIEAITAVQEAVIAGRRHFVRRPPSVTKTYDYEHGVTVQAAYARFYVEVA